MIFLLFIDILIENSEPVRKLNRIIQSESK